MLNVLLNVLNVDWSMMKLHVLKTTVSMDTMKFKVITELSHVLVVKDLNKISETFSDVKLQDNQEKLKPLNVERNSLNNLWFGLISLVTIHTLMMILNFTSLEPELILNVSIMPTIVKKLMIVF